MGRNRLLVGNGSCELRSCLPAGIGSIFVWIVSAVIPIYLIGAAGQMDRIHVQLSLERDTR